MTDEVSCDICKKESQNIKVCDGCDRLICQDCISVVHQGDPTSYWCMGCVPDILGNLEDDDPDYSP